MAGDKKVGPFAVQNEFLVTLYEDDMLPLSLGSLNYSLIALHKGAAIRCYWLNGKNIKIYAQKEMFFSSKYLSQTSQLIIVRYHCGGGSEEVNSCILISYKVYL